jgi:hypothetical protein
MKNKQQPAPEPSEPPTEPGFADRAVDATEGTAAAGPVEPDSGPVNPAQTLDPDDVRRFGPLFEALGRAMVMMREQGLDPASPGSRRGLEAMVACGGWKPAAPPPAEPPASE